MRRALIRPLIRRETPRRARGFSLLEALVAFTVLALVLGGLFQVFGTGLRAAYLSDRYSRATLFAQSKLAEIAAGEELTAASERGAAEPDLQWESTITPYEDPDADSPDEVAMALWSVTVEVGWADEDRRPSVSLSTLVLRPTR